MFDTFKYEWKIRRLLKSLAMQRVGMVLQPGNVWVLELALEKSEENEALLYTCQLRGWIGMLHESIPTSGLGTNGSTLYVNANSDRQHIWTITDAGWAVIQRRQHATAFGIAIAIVGLLIPFVNAYFSSSVVG